MPSKQTTVTDKDVAALIARGIAQGYIDNEDWLDPGQVTTRAQQEANIVRSSSDSCNELLSDPKVMDAFTGAFTDHYNSNAPTTA